MAYSEDSPAISVLVPICNVEKYLDQCLESLVNQTLRNIEIICLNDGSTDSSLSIIQKYAESDSRIVVVNKKNTGYGDTMNLGIRKARGKYIGIVESDDFIDPEMFEDLYNLAERNGSDIVKSNFYYYFTDLSEASSQYDRAIGAVWSNELQKVITKNNTLADLISADMDGKTVCPRDEDEWLFYLPSSIWSAIYKRSFIESNKIEFLPTPGASYQDTGFAFKTLAMANRVTLSSHAYLHYRQDNEKSSINNPGKVMCVVDEHKEIRNFLQKNNLYTTKMLKIANHLKFGNYKWNLNRLNLDLALKFLPVMSQEFKNDRDEKTINWYLIDETDTRMLNEIIDNPDMYAKRLKAWHNALVSVIVPIYNVENYIDECICSILSQSLKNIEVVCVDDGCQDSSIEKVTKYWAKDPRINLIHQFNRGLSGARNYGMHSAHADFIMFCDSDDTYDKTMCKKLYADISDSQADLSACGINVVYHSNFDNKRDDRLYYQIKFSGQQNIGREVLEQTDVSSCDKIFRRSMIRRYDLHFPEGLLYEDYYFVKSYMLLSHTISYVDEYLYNYVRRPGSIMASTFANNSSKALDHMTIYLWLFDDYNKKYNLIARDPQYFVDEFKGTFTFSKTHLPDDKLPELYRTVNEFLNKNYHYLNKCSSSIVPSIQQLLPRQEQHNHKLRVKVKQLYKKISPGYRNRRILENELANLELHINQSLVKLDKQITRIKNR